MNKTIIAIHCIIIFFTVSLSNLSAQTTIIKAGKLVDPKSGTTQTNMYITIEGNKIISVDSKLKSDKSDEIIDLSNMTVLPGLTSVDSAMDQSVVSIIERRGDWHSLTMQ